MEYDKSEHKDVRHEWFVLGEHKGSTKLYSENNGNEWIMSSESYSVEEMR